MSLVNFGPIFYPNLGTNIEGATLNTSFTLDAAGEKNAVVFRVPKSGTLNRVGFRTGTVTTGDTLRISFQDVAADGFPDEVVDQYVDQAILSTDDNLSFFVGPLTHDGTAGGTKRTVTRGDWLAIVLEYPSYVAGNLQLFHFNTTSGRRISVNAVIRTKLAGVWARSGTVPRVILEYSDGSYGHILGVQADVNTFPASASYNSSSSPNEYGNVIQVPAQCRASGIWWYGNTSVDNTTFTQDFELTLYAADGSTVLGAAVWDASNQSSINTVAVRNVYAAYFTGGDVTLSTGVSYRVAAKATAATSISRTVQQSQSNAALSQLNSSDIYLTSRTGVGAWSDTTTDQMAIGLILTAVHDGTSVPGTGYGTKVNQGLNTLLNDGLN